MGTRNRCGWERETGKGTVKQLLLRIVIVATITILASGSAFAEWGKKVYAPYTDTCLWPNPDLTEGSEVGVKNYVLAFIVAKSSTDPTPTWGGYSAYNMTHMKSAIDKLRAGGGEVMISLGGEANTPLAVAATSVDGLTAIYKQIIDAYDLTKMDFDIEGAWVWDSDSIERRSKALAKLQSDSSYDKVEIWYTLPVNPTGLDAGGLAVVESALKNGVNLSGINIMAMCWGDNFLPSDGSAGDMGALAIQSGESTHAQLKTLFKQYGIEKTDSEIYAMLGITPMIGKNYSDRKIFTVEDTQELATWASEKGVGLLSMWSINRDQYNGTDLVEGSGVEQEAYDFSKEFVKFVDGGGSDGSPNAVADTATTTQDTAVTINVLANDSDPDGDAISITKVTTPGNGTATISDGKITYTPKSGYYGTDSFTYTISDDKDGTDSATVTVTVNRSSSSAAAFKVVSDWSSGFTGQITVTNTSSSAVTSWKVEFDFPYTISSIWNASIVSHSGNHYVIENASWNGSLAAGAKATFGFSASPGNVSSDPTNYVFLPNGTGGGSTNNSPVAKNDTVETDQDMAVTIDVLANDSDADGDTITIANVVSPANGTAVITGNKIVYTPAAGFNGSDSFSYNISDGNGGTATATVTVTVNPAGVNSDPVAVNDTVTTNQDTAVTVDVLANDTDPDGDTVLLLSVGNPSHGTAAISGGKVVYTPASGYTGSDSFSYTVSDGKEGTASATVSVTVKSSGGSGTTADFTVATDWGSGFTGNITVTNTSSSATTSWKVEFDFPYTITAIWNAKLVSHSGDHYVIENESWNGKLAAGAKATFGFNGSPGNVSGKPTNYVFLPNGVGGSDSGDDDTSDDDTDDGDDDTTTTNSPPVAGADSGITTKDTAVTIYVLANDSDPDGDTLVIDSVTDPANGSAEISGTKVVYTPDSGYTGNDSFSYQINDGNGNIASALVTVTVSSEGSGIGTRKVVGYYTNWSMYRTPNFKPLSIDGSKITHINYAFAKQDTSGNILLTDSWADVEYRDDWNTTRDYWGNFYQLKQLKEKYPNLKVLISIGGWSLSNNFSAMAADADARANFVRNCIKFCETYDCFDGIDLDWEYPGYADHGGQSVDKENFTKLLQELHTALKAHSPQLLLSIAAPCGPTHYKNLELDKIHQYLDWINLMSYDFHGSWDTITNHNSPLYATEQGDSDFNINSAVQYYLGEGVPAEKLLVGLPLYGRSFAGAASTSDGLYSSFSGAGSGTTSEAGVRFFSDIKNNLLSTYTRYWDSKSQVPYLYNLDSSSAQYQEFISYDDEQSIAVKGKYIVDNKLGGFMIWELGMDTWDDDNAALSAVNQALSEE